MWFCMCRLSHPLPRAKTCYYHWRKRDVSCKYHNAHLMSTCLMPLSLQCVFYFFPSIMPYSNAVVLRLSLNVNSILNHFPLSIFRASFIRKTHCGSCPYLQSSLLMKCLWCMYFNPHSVHKTWNLSRCLCCKNILVRSVSD